MAPGGRADAIARAVAAASGARAVVLVEAASDEHALVALARRRGRDLAAEGVHILPMGGASAPSRYLPRSASLVRSMGFSPRWRTRRTRGGRRA